MAVITYEHATDSLYRTILALRAQARCNLDNDSQPYIDRADGAVRAWRDMFGSDVREEDAEAIALLIDDMSGTEDASAGNWHLTPVTHLR